MLTTTASIWYDIVTLLSLGLTVPFILGSGLVIYIWYRLALSVIKKPKKELTDREWMMMGVFLSFLAAFMDNCYWQIAWSSKYLGLSITDSLMHFGIVPNLPFRQILGLMAVYCHVKSAILYSKTTHKAFTTFWMCAFGLGVVYVTVLFLLKAWL